MQMDPELACLGRAIRNKVDKSVVAHHEAGHAVVTYLSPTIRLVDVSIDADGKGLGRCNTNLCLLETCVTSSELTPSQRADFKESIKSLLGGQVAEMRFLGPEYKVHCDMGWGDDDRRIAVYLEYIAGTAGASEQLRELRAETERDIEVNWRFVEAVAGALLEKTRLSGAEVENIYKKLARSA
jgi:ATP-dependent Zn protease